MRPVCDEHTGQRHHILAETAVTMRAQLYQRVHTLGLPTEQG